MQGWRRGDGGVDEHPGEEHLLLKSVCVGVANVLRRLYNRLCQNAS